MMLGARTGAWSGKRLPYDAEVEWLQGDGQAYIDLGFGITATDTSYCDISFIPVFNENTPALTGICGFFSGALTANFISVVSSTRKARVFRNNSDFLSADVTEDDVVRIYETKGEYYISVNGETVKSKTGTIKIKYWATLFRITKSATSNVTYKIPVDEKIISAKGGDGINEFDLITVRKDGVGYMYDRVSGKLYGNAADSGAFILGPDKTT